MKFSLGIMLIFLLSCETSYVDEKVSDELILYDSFDSLEAMYYVYVDTLIRYPNEVIIISSRLDTIIREVGIFTFLKYDFELKTPRDLINKLRAAIKTEGTNGIEVAYASYQEVIQLYHDLASQKYRGDTNGYLEYKVNASIICSYAYEKIGDIDQAIETLKPYMANAEVYGSKIQERYIKLCIQKYGIKAVRNELKQCGASIKFVDRPISFDNWIVEVFGGEIGIDSGISVDSISVEEATKRIQRMNIDGLVN